jgi:hypothetical protein
LTTIVLVERVNVIGGRSLIADRNYADAHPDDVPPEARLAELTLETPFDWLTVCDRRLAHYVSPIFARRNGHGWRTVLLVDFTPLRAVTSADLLSNE